MMKQLKDIELAKVKLLDEGFALVIVKEGVVLYSSRERGIKPIYTAVSELGSELIGASLADRVIGKAAALLCKMAQFKSVYTNLISDSAIKVFNENNIRFSYRESCPFIINRRKDGMCPVEKISLNIDSGELLLPEIERFLQEVSSK